MRTRSAPMIRYRSRHAAPPHSRCSGSATTLVDRVVDGREPTRSRRVSPGSSGGRCGRAGWTTRAGAGAGVGRVGAAVPAGAPGRKGLISRWYVVDRVWNATSGRVTPRNALSPTPVRSQEVLGGPLLVSDGSPSASALLWP